MTGRRRLDLDRLPDVRDGLTRVERVVIHQLHVLQKERRGGFVPTAQLYGRVVEHIDISVAELQAVLVRLGARQHGTPEADASDEPVERLPYRPLPPPSRRRGDH